MKAIDGAMLELLIAGVDENTVNINYFLNLSQQERLSMTL